MQSCSVEISKNSFISSPNNNTLQNSDMFAKSLINSKNSNGPRWLPWGTPDGAINLCDSYALRRTMPFYPEMPTGRHPEKNPVFRLCHCYNELAPKLVNPQEFSLEINMVAALIKKLTLIYE